MPKKKGKFIDKKKAISFRLVHRSQRDPLAADSEAPQHVLQPLDGGASALDPEERRKAQVKYGVYYEDDYDYMQHLRTVEEYHNVHLSEPINAPTEAVMPDVEDDDPEGVRLFRKTSRGFVPITQEQDEVSAKTTKATTAENQVCLGRDLKLPASAFASFKEEKIDLVNQGASNSQGRGPLIGWDPDIVEALDDDFDLDDPENLLDDDFVLKANKGVEFGSSDDDDDDEDSDGEWTSEDDSDDYEEADGMDVVATRFASATHLENEGEGAVKGVMLTTGEDVGYLKAKIAEMKRAMGNQSKSVGFEDDNYAGSNYGDFDDLEDAKSRFTEYSMTSSVIRRNDKLKLVDDQFERLYQEYDDDLIGGLDSEEIVSGGIFNIPANVEGIEGVNNGLKPFKAILEEFEVENAKLPATEVLAKLRDMEASKTEINEGEGEEDLVRLTLFEKPKENNNWDCESILSTYSNLYNHPKTIAEPSKKKCKKRGGCNDDDETSSVSSRNVHNDQIKLSSKSGLPLGVLPVAGPTQRQLEALDYDGLTRLRTAPSLRPNDESAEERRLRKKAVKEERRERRLEKKANTAAFKDEEKRQMKTMKELQSNVKGIKIH